MSPVPTVTHEAFESLWTPKDVAEYLRASRSWVYQRAEAGDLPCLRLGGLLRFDPEAIRAWVKGREHGATVTPITQVKRG
jgi:excisionase family DNA binding protein